MLAWHAREHWLKKTQRFACARAAAATAPPQTRTAPRSVCAAVSRRVIMPARPSGRDPSVQMATGVAFGSFRPLPLRSKWWGRRPSAGVDGSRSPTLEIGSIRLIGSWISAEVSDAAGASVGGYGAASDRGNYAVGAGRDPYRSSWVSPCAVVDASSRSGSGGGDCARRAYGVSPAAAIMGLGGRCRQRAPLPPFADVSRIWNWLGHWPLVERQSVNPAPTADQRGNGASMGA